jgi:hypothetical protein
MQVSSLCVWSLGDEQSPMMQGVEHLAAVLDTLVERRCCEHTKTFVKQLRFMPHLLRACRGKIGLSRDTVSMLFVMYGRQELGPLREEQQHHIRRSRGLKVAYDNPCKAAASLAGSLSTAVDASGRAKVTPFKASIATMTAEDGLVLFALLCPNDKQKYFQAGILGLYGGEMPEEHADDVYLTSFADRVRAGGPLGKCARLIATDNVGKDKNAWHQCPTGVVEACIETGIPILVPLGLVRIGDTR